MDLAQRVKGEIPNLTDADWEWVESRNFVSEAEATGDLGPLIAEIRALHEHHRCAGQGSATQAEPSADPGELAMRASARAEALAAIFGADAGRRDDVVAFRRNALRGRLLKPERAGDWIRRRAKRGTPVRHVRLPWPPGPDDLRVLEERSDAGQVPPFSVFSPTLKYVAYRNDRRFVASVVSTDELEPLRRLAESLAGLYGWEPATATEFVLAGRVPVVPPVWTERSLDMGVPACSRIVMTVDPTVTPDEVKARFAAARKAMLGGKRMRRMSPKHLQLAIFAHGHREGTWEDRMMAWNAQAPEYSYNSRQHFQRDATDALRRLIEPPLSRA